jgi:NADP-dependent 3-hydroxy acid dehydrogenase YdfG
MRAEMVQSEDVGDLIRYVACLPPHVVLNEIWITPTRNRASIATLAAKL